MNLNNTTTDGQRIFWLCIFISLFGVLIIYSGTSAIAAQKFGEPFLFVKKQLQGIIVGLIGCAVIFRLPFKFFEKMTLPILAVSLFFLCLVFVPGLGSKGGGATRWISFGGFTFQPAELAKLAIILFLAKNLSRPSFRVRNFWRGVAPNLILYGAFAALLINQPDLGTAFVLGIITLMFLFIGGMSWRLVAGSVVGSILLLALAIFAAPYRMRRIFGFLDPWSTAQTSGFQIIQSFLAFKNGGLWGAGLGASKQKLYFLFAAHTDFVLALIAEELGFIGVLAVSLSFIYFTYLGFRIMARQTEKYRQLVVFGIVSLISFQAFFNMAVTMGLAPTKGISLPFISSGSSSLIVFLCCVAIVAKLDKESRLGKNSVYENTVSTTS